MTYDVFISHSAKDKTTADAVCAILESRRIRCWVAPRDLLPGTDWGEAIIHAISQSRVMVLILSSNANRSAHVKREVERAVNKNVIIVPLRVEDVQPSGSLEYFLSTQHWIDAITPPLEKHLQQMAESIKALLSTLPTDIRPEHVIEPEALVDETAQSAPRQVSSLKEVEALSQKGRVLLFTFYAEAGDGETSIRKTFESAVFPAIEQVAAAKNISLCYARSRSMLSHTAIGKELKQLGLEVRGIFLFRQGKVIKHKNASFIGHYKES